MRSPATPEEEADLDNFKRIRELREKTTLPRKELQTLLETLTQEDENALYESARQVRESRYGKDVYLRGLIEFTNYCKNDCFYCGIRRSNKNAQRYRLSDEEILSYIASGEPMDKAGAYGIQEKGSVFVTGIKGDYFNVMGLPICEITQIAEKEFGIKLTKF